MTTTPTPDGAPEPTSPRIEVDRMRQWYAESTGRAGDTARQLAFAGLGVVWLFSGGTVASDGGLDVPHSLLWPGFLVVLALACDFLQYLYKGAAWGIYARVLELKGQRTAPGAPRWINWPTIVFFWGKLVLVSAAYVGLGSYFIGRL